MDIRDEFDGILTQFFNLRRKKVPNTRTYSLVKQTLLLLLTVISAVAFILARYLQNIENLETEYLIPLAILLFILFCLVLSISSQPKNDQKLTFKVPFVPILPSISVFINIYLMLKLSLATWIRFFVWLIIGLTIYLLYGIKHSEENNQRSNISARVREEQFYGSTKAEN